VDILAADPSSAKETTSRSIVFSYEFRPGAQEGRNIDLAGLTPTFLLEKVPGTFF
jgi:hypothetical protein